MICLGMNLSPAMLPRFDENAELQAKNFFGLMALMNEMRQFEMRIVSGADFLKHHPSRFIRFLPWLMIIEVVVLSEKLIKKGWDLWAFVHLLSGIFIAMLRWFPGCFLQPKSRYVVLDESVVRFPRKVFGTIEIPRSQVREVSVTAKGLIIAWQKDGVPWYTELLAIWFSEEEWGRLRSALLPWGNPQIEEQRTDF